MSRTLAINHQYLYFKHHKKHLINRIDEAPRKTPFFTVVYIKRNEDNKAANIDTKRSNEKTGTDGNYSILQNHHKRKQSVEQESGKSTSGKQGSIKTIRKRSIKTIRKHYHKYWWKTYKKQKTTVNNL